MPLTNKVDITIVNLSMKFFGKLIFTVLIFSIFIFSPSLAFAAMPKATPAPIEVNSYELFWPIVAGRVQGDPVYTLKLFKEKLRAQFIFSNIKKAEYNAVLSEKRLLEFEKLTLVNKDFVNAVKTADLLRKTQSEAVTRLEMAQSEGLDIALSSQMISEIFDKEASLLQSILGKVEVSQKESVTSLITNLSSLSSKLN